MALNRNSKKNTHYRRRVIFIDALPSPSAANNERLIFAGKWIPTRTHAGDIPIKPRVAVARLQKAIIAMTESRSDGLVSRRKLIQNGNSRCC
jgi:hypothetical protein